MHQKAASLDTGEAEDPGRNGGTDIGAHDNTDGLAQRHQTGIDETDNHNRSGRRALNNGGNTKAGQQTHQAVLGHLFQQRAQATACPALQGLAHQIHAEEEQTKTANEVQCIKNSHYIIPFPYSPF